MAHKLNTPQVQPEKPRQVDAMASSKELKRAWFNKRIQMLLGAGILSVSAGCSSGPDETEVRFSDTDTSTCSESSENSDPDQLPPPQAENDGMLHEFDDGGAFEEDLELDAATRPTDDQSAAKKKQ